MRRPVVALLASLLAVTGFFFTPATHAGRIDPALESHLATLAPGELVPVIVELTEQADPHAAASAFAPSDRRARGRAVVEALRDAASRHQPPLLALLAQENARDVKALWVFNAIAVTTTEPVIRRLAGRPDVRELRLDKEIPAPKPRPSSVSAASFAEPLWNIAQIRAPEVWALDPAYTGTGVVVGSFDTGVDGAHPELAPRYRGNHAISWFDPYNQHATPYDQNGHGTHTTGTMVGGDASGSSIGVAPGAQWIAAKAWNDADRSRTSAFHEIFQWFLAPGGDPANAPDVVNNSWGQTPATCFQEFRPDVQALRAAGIAPIFASGNNGPDPGTALAPGSFAESYSVGATDYFDDIAYFSGRGPSPCDGAIKPDISAPGVGILSTFPGGYYYELDGTSMATPHVSGAAAVLRAIKPAITVDEIESALSAGAVDLGIAGPDNDFGVGRLDLFESARIVLGLSTLGIVATTPTAREAGLVPGAFTVTRKGDTSQPLTVTYTVGGTATPGSDYVALPGTLTLPAGTASATIVVTPLDDAIVELDETVVVTLDPDPALLLSPAQATVTIVSDDVPPDLTVWAFTSPTTGAAGAPVTVSDTTRNIGTTPSGASRTNFYLSANSVFDAGDLLLARRAVAALAPGGSDSGSVAVTIPPGTPAGSYYLIAKADGDDALVEASETNNTYANNIQVGPDLTIWSLNVPGDAGAGLPVTLSDTTKNTGAGPAGASTTSYYLSTNTVLDAGDVLLGSRAVPALAGGASDAGSATVTVPSGTATGTYYVIVKADSADAVAEVWESNNVLYGQMRVGPDLVVSAISAPAAAGAGGTISVSDTTRNAGGGAASATTTRFFFSSNNVLDAGDTLLGSRAVAALGPGASDTGSASLTIPAGTPAGSYYIIALADADNALVESQEGNNTLARSIQVGADLTVWSFTVPSDAGAGLAVTFTDTTKNTGAGAAPASTTGYYLSTNTVLDAGDVLLGTRAVPALAGGASDTGSATMTIPAGTATGTYYVIAKADASDTIGEIWETNNTLYWQMRIGPDLAVSSVTAPSASGAGATITVSDTTRNSGGGTAAATTTRYFWSANSTLDASDIALGSRAVASLAPGASDTGSLSVTIPAGLAAGTYYVIAKADADDALVETQESNNAFARSIQIGADLVVSSLTVPGDSGAGLAIAVTDTTKNLGSGAAPASTTSYYLSSNTSFDASDVLLGSRGVAALAAGASDTATTSLTIPASTATGIYFVIARADAGDAVSETYETNNTTYAQLRIGPDLTVTALTAPSSSGAGATITVSDTTRNAGGGSAAATATRYYLSTNSVLDAADVLLASRAVAALAPGASDTGSATVTIPAGTAAGTYYIIAKADGDDTLAETQEANNTNAKSLQVGSDLTVWSFTVPSDAGAGLAITLTDTTKNVGAGAAPASTTSYYLSSNTLLDAGDVLLGSRPVAALAAGASDTASVSVTVPAGTPTGVYYVIAKADAGDAVSEIYETNNTLYWQMRVGPDLTVWSLSAPGLGEAGSSVSVTDTTRNSGGGTAPATSTRFYFSANSLLDASDVLLGSRAVPALAPGAMDSATVSLTIPAGTPAGSYYIIAVADGDNAVAETQEGNNAYARNIQVGADLTVWSFSVPTDAGAGLAVTLTDTTKNVGGGAAPASATRYFLSVNTVLDSGDTLLGGRAIAPLAPGASDTGSATVTVPAGTAPGVYYVIAKADADNAIGEVWESNNTLYWQMRVGPDLGVASFTAPTSAAAGAAITLGDTTRNTGGAAVSATNTRFYLSTNTALDASDVLLGARAVAALAAGASEAGSIGLAIPAGTAPGTYYLIAKADGDDAVAESQEGNNTYVRSIQVTAP